jgi:hypothetical protein
MKRPHLWGGVSVKIAPYVRLQFTSRGPRLVIGK